MSYEYSGISRELPKTKYLQIAKLEFNHEELYRTDDIRVIFIAVFKPIGPRNACPKCRIRWVSPDGELFRDEPARFYDGNFHMFSAALPIYRNRASRLPGQWRVELYSTDAVIVGYDFVIEPQEQAAGLESYSYQEVQLVFPAGGWRKIAEDSQSVHFSRAAYPRGSMTLAVFPVDVFPVARGRSREQHIEGYFDYERTKERPPAVIWSGFEEGVREIGDTNYPVMSFYLRDERDTRVRPQIEGLFLIIFTKDLQQRHRFYVLMWQEINLREIPGTGLTQLEAIVKAISFGHFDPPK